MLETASLKDTSAREVRPEIVVQVASRLIEAGGLPNYVRSAALSEASVAPGLLRSLRSRRRLIGRTSIGTCLYDCCWWLRYARLLVVGGVWAGGLIVPTVPGAWRRSRRS
jgi:hypothetical protein